MWALGRWKTEPDQGAVYLVDVWTEQDPKVKRPPDSAVTRMPRSDVHLTQLWPRSQGQTTTWLSCDQNPKVNVHMTQLWPGFKGQTSTWLNCDQDSKVKRPHDSAVTRIPRSNVNMTHLWPGPQSQTSTWLSIYCLIALQYCEISQA